MSRRKLNITMDLDGVIHRYNSGWCGHDSLPDLPVQGVLDWMRAQMDEGHKITIFSMRNAANDYLLNLDFVLQKYQEDKIWDRNPSDVQDVQVDVATIVEAQEAILNWLTLHGMEAEYINKLKFSVGKPHFDIYIDDRGFRFNNINELPEIMNRDFCKPWWVGK